MRKYCSYLFRNVLCSNAVSYKPTNI
uniref:Uncharacterized protein n=1 Tax=Anguilla anguilla TaxID=7936 RepID=A0A0E9T7V0_ANGAN